MSSNDSLKVSCIHFLTECMKAEIAGLRCVSDNSDACYNLESYVKVVQRYHAAVQDILLPGIGPTTVLTLVPKDKHE